MLLDDSSISISLYWKKLSRLTAEKVCLGLQIARTETKRRRIEGDICEAEAQSCFSEDSHIHFLLASQLSWPCSFQISLENA